MFFARIQHIKVFLVVNNIIWQLCNMKASEKYQVDQVISKGRRTVAGEKVGAK